nr:MAG TPA: hypothetical protein [Caudoviricetes sp.]
MYATMGVWERIHLRSHSLLLFPPQPRRLPGYIRRTSASAHTSGPEGLALHAATSPFTGIRQCAPKAKELTAERRLPQGLKQPLPWGIGNGARLSWRRKRRQL